MFTIASICEPVIRLSEANIKTCSDDKEICIKFYRKVSRNSVYQRSSSVPSLKNSIGKSRNIVVTNAKSISVSGGVKGKVFFNTIDSFDKLTEIEKIDSVENNCSFYLGIMYDKNHRVFDICIDILTTEGKHIHAIFAINTAGHQHETGHKQKQYYENTDEYYVVA